MRRVPRRFTNPQTVSWCVCKYTRPMGYLQHPDHDEEFLVHSDCMNPAKAYWEATYAHSAT